MNILRKSPLIAAGLCLAFAASAVLAQTAPSIIIPKSTAKAPAKPGGKTLSGNAPGGGKLMTRDELRSCLKRLDDLNRNNKELDALRPTLDRERDELKAAGEALKKERTDLDAQLPPIREWENKVRAHGADIEAFNKRNDAAPEAPRNQQEKLAQDLKAERERLEKNREALSAEESKLVPAYRAAAAAHNERVGVRDAKVCDWNARNAAAVETSGKQQEARSAWLTECANRPYQEDDEKAIKAGK